MHTIFTNPTTFYIVESCAKRTVIFSIVYFMGLSKNRQIKKFCDFYTYKPGPPGAIGGAEGVGG